MRVVITLVLLSLQIAMYAQRDSFIPVESEAGISVFLDNSFKGKTTLDIKGLIIEGVTSGSHIIKLVKEGFNSQEERIIVKSGEVLTYIVKPFIPVIKIVQSGNTESQEIDLQVGNLKIQSVPIELSIKIPRLGINSAKKKDEWKATHIPMGIYPAIYTWNNKVIRDTIVIRKNIYTHLCRTSYLREPKC